MPEKTEEKEKMLNYQNIVKYSDNFDKVFKNYIGYKKEIEYFNKNNYKKKKKYNKIVCLSGPPGIGKTVFVRKLAMASGREPLFYLNCASLKSNCSVLPLKGNKKNPSIIAKSILGTECSNPIIFFDELEKAEEISIQKELIEIFKCFKENRIFFDTFYEQNLDLNNIDFILAVNFLEELSPKLKSMIFIREIEGYNNEEKKEILKLKKNDFLSKFGEKQVYDYQEIINYLVDKRIKERGIRKLEFALYRIMIHLNEEKKDVSKE